MVDLEKQISQENSTEITVISVSEEFGSQDLGLKCSQSDRSSRVLSKFQ